jgi:hypothetical protein
MLDLLTEVSRVSIAMVAEATDPVYDFIQYLRFSRLRQRIEQWFFSHL